MKTNNTIFYNIAQNIKYFEKYLKFNDQKNTIYNESILHIFQKMYANAIKYKTGLDLIEIKIIDNIYSTEIVKFACMGKNKNIVHLIFIPTLVRALYHLHWSNVRIINNTNNNSSYNFLEDDIIDLTNNTTTTNTTNKYNNDDDIVNSNKVFLLPLNDIQKRLLTLYLIADHAASHFTYYLNSPDKNPNWNHNKFNSLSKLLTIESSEDVQDRLETLYNINNCLT